MLTICEQERIVKLPMVYGSFTANLQGIYNLLKQNKTNIITLNNYM